MFMVDWGKPAKEMQAALLAEKVQIGRNWPIWPNVSRVAVGSAEEMKAFCDAVARVWKAWFGLTADTFGNREAAHIGTAPPPSFIPADIHHARTNRATGK